MSYTQKQQGILSSKKIGTRYEELAGRYLKQLGYILVAMNYRCKLGEIDIIAKQGDYVVFLEVKYKADSRHGYPRESVTYSKQKRIIRTAIYYLTTTHQYGIPCRFDVIEILEDEITHIENAFM